MDKKVLDYVVKKSHELMNAPTCSKETKEAAKAWLHAVGTKKEKEMTKSYIAELEEDIMPIDTLIDFAQSEGGLQVFGFDKAKEVVKHAREIKSSGAAYCDCPACEIVAEILEKKEMLLQ